MIKSIESINVVKVSKQHYKIEINGVVLGILERSELRHLIEKLDNAIEVGVTKKVEINPMTSEEFMELIKQGREADENDDDCTMCGS
tara:strand:- start:46 stop:306 length:261 start_codon:yes stop_codon:yes gene_type:complete